MCNPLTPTVAIWVQLYVSDRVKPSFLIFDIRALWRSALSVRVSGYQKLQMTVKTRSGTGCLECFRFGWCLTETLL